MTERGQASVLVIGLVLVTFAAAGIATDGTRAFLLRRTLQNSADSASLAGASTIDRMTYYASGGRSVRLDPATAKETAMRMLGRRGLEVMADVTVSSTRVAVILRGRVETGFLGLLGIDSLPVVVEAVARPVTAPGG